LSIVEILLGKELIKRKLGFIHQDIIILTGIGSRSEKHRR